MSYFKQTSEIRTELKSDYIFVRNLNPKGGVIDAILTEKQSEKVAKVLQSIETENFSTVWGLLKKIKGVRFSYSSN